MAKKIIIISVILVVLIFGISYWYYKNETTNPSITLLSPNGGDTIEEGTIFPIQWSTNNIPENYKISITLRRVPPPPLQEEGQEFDPVIFTDLPNTGSAEWMVSNMYPDGNYILGITAYASTPITNPISDESDATFHIAKVKWQTYVNKKFGYSIDYPVNWVFREFPDTQSGAGFRPQNSSSDIASECITIDERGTAANEYVTPFADYVKKAAATEIQGYEKLNSIETITTASGIVGYETAWLYKNINGQEEISLPITYFNNKKIVGGMRYKTTQIILNNKDCQAIYDQMLSTFKQ